jgi:hypothetical protein
MGTKAKEAPSSVFDHDRNMYEATMAITRLRFDQLLTLQASLSEHIFNVYQRAQIDHEIAKEKTKTGGKVPPVQ